jgi:hypothetical protein
MAGVAVAAPVGAATRLWATQGECTTGPTFRHWPRLSPFVLKLYRLPGRGSLCGLSERAGPAAGASARFLSPRGLVF